jgi:hypothetical protein
MDMENTLYRTYVGKMRDECWEEWSAYITVTHEANGFAVWSDMTSRSENEGLILFTRQREAAIEYAVYKAAAIRDTFKGVKYLRDDAADANAA